MSRLPSSLLGLLGGPASIDWCEPNYVVSPYVAEFANTWSSLFMCATALFALVWKWRQGRELRFLWIEGCVIVIGLGSALFHGTLTFYGQLADGAWGYSESRVLLTCC
jgi:dihydroceramidase